MKQRDVSNGIQYLNAVFDFKVNKKFKKRIVIFIGKIPGFYFVQLVFRTSRLGILYCLNYHKPKIKTKNAINMLIAIDNTLLSI